jgi:hypothetical protein
MSLIEQLSNVEERFDATFAYEYEPRYNVAPGSGLATVDAVDRSAITAREWGLVPPWADDPGDGPRPINARAETVADRATFREAYRERRCLVLADGYYEWTGTRGAKQPYRVTRADSEPFAFAGIWETRAGDDVARETVAIIHEEGGDGVAMKADVADDGQIAAVVDETVARYGRIDVLHNNVGILEVGGPVEASEESWDRVMDVNLKSMFLTCKYVLPVMQRQKRGAIVNVSSIAGIRWTGVPYISYAASKAGALQFTR